MPALDLPKLKTMVEIGAELTEHARSESERDRDYYDDHQWTAEEREILRKRKQPVMTINRIKRKVDAMIGLEQRMRTDPKALPRGPEDEDAAQAATKALVFVDDNTRFDSIRSQVFENAIVEGYGGVEIVAEMRRGRPEIVINRLRWEEIVFDPHSREKDFSDAAYLGSHKWMSLDAAMEAFGAWWQGEPEELATMLEQSMVGREDGETYDDRPRSSQYRWADRRQKRVRVAQLYYRNAGNWYLALFCGGGIIFNDLSPYVDEDGGTTCPIQLMTAYVDRENRRYGVVRSMISQQDEINKRRSKLLHMLNSRQTMGVKGAVDPAMVKRELARPDGHVDIDPEAFEVALAAGVKPFEILGQNDQIAGQFSLLQESKSEIDMFGPNPSLIGQTEGNASGRAIMAQQQAGMAELAPLYDSLRDWTIRCYRSMWERIKQFWTEERWVRVMDAAGQMQWVAFNKQTGMQVQQDPMTGMTMLAPQIENPVAEMDIDLVIEDVPDHVTLQQEQFEQLTQMADQGLPIPPEMIIKASSVKDKSELLQMLQQQQQAAAQQAQQAQQAAFQLEAMKVQAVAQKDMAQAAKTAAEVQETEADTAKTRVETMRLMREPIRIPTAAG